MKTKMTERKQNLKAGVLVSYLWVIVHIGVNFLYTPFLIKYLGKSEYGLYQVIASFLAYINVIETSLSAGVLRFYCNAKAKKDKLKVENILALCRKIYKYFSGGVLVIGIAVIFMFRIFYQSSFSKHEIVEGSIMLGLLFTNLLVTMTNAIYLAAIKGNERFVFEKALAIASQILQPIICALIIMRYPYATIVTFVQVIMNVAVALVRYGYAKKKLGIVVKLHENDRMLAMNVLVFAANILLANIADQIFLKTDQIILGKLYNTATVAVYAVGSQIYTNYMYAGITVASVFFPRVSKYYQEENGLQKISDLFIKVGRIAFFLCLLVFSGFVVFGKEFLYLWVGDDFQDAYYIAIVVMIPFTIDIIQNLGLTILQVMNRYSFRAKMYFVAACFNIISTIVFAYFWKGFGAALSTGISMFITSGIMLNVFYAKKICLDIKKFWINISGIAVKMIPVVLIFFFLNSKLNIRYAWISFAGKIFIYCVVYFIVLYFSAFNLEEKITARCLLSKLISHKF